MANTHHIATIGGVSRSYDLNGNTTVLASGQFPTFSFDDRNRLALATISQTNGTTTARYWFNGRGERVAKSETQVDGMNTIKKFAYAYSYDEGGHLLGEYSNGLVSGPEYIYVDGIPVAMVTYNTQVGTSQAYYIETDQLGTPRQVIKPGATTASDATVWKWDYFASNSAFGENTPSVQTVTFNLRFPGQYFDSETGLNYNYFRDYEPGTGRYVESDPRGLGGISTYAYVRSNPQLLFDSFGLAASYSGLNKDDENYMREANETAIRVLKHCTCEDCTAV